MKLSVRIPLLIGVVVFATSAALILLALRLSSKTRGYHNQTGRECGCYP